MRTWKLPLLMAIAALSVPATASALTLRKRCFETAQVPLKLPETPGPTLPVRVVLRRAPNCR